MSDRKLTASIDSIPLILIARGNIRKGILKRSMQIWS